MMPLPQPDKNEIAEFKAFNDWIEIFRGGVQ
jgi:hypothetical protein